ncbi:MAG: hypothetical protein ACRENI_07825 [Gemmatimonadaceae bacterium]
MTHSSDQGDGAARPSRETGPADGERRAVRGPPPAMLAVIRIAMLLGVLMLGGFVLFIQRQGRWTAAPAERLETLAYLGYSIWVIAIAGIIFLRGRGARMIERGRYASASIIGWSLCEAAAIFGGMFYFLSGSPVWYINGLLLLVISFLILPMRR